MSEQCAPLGDPSYEEVDDLLFRTKTAYEDGTIAATVVKQAQDITYLVETIPGFQGAFFTGYPFYALSDDGLVATPTIPLYLQSMRDVLAENKQNQHRDFGNRWPCADCQDHGGLDGATDSISYYCLPCVRTPLRPRQLFRALPDVDTFLLFDEVTPDVEDMVASRIGSVGMRYCEANIRQSYAEATAYLDGDSSARLPVDLHLMNAEDYVAACEGMARERSVSFSVPTHTLFMRWHRRRIDIGSDLLFSATTFDSVAPVVAEAMYDARLTLAQEYTDTEIVGFMGPRMQELIHGSDEMEANFAWRLAQWREGRKTLV